MSASRSHNYKISTPQEIRRLLRTCGGRGSDQELPPNDPRSFFALGGFHGEPFRGPGKTDSQYWGGYCHHGNVLFPTWHRMYVLKLEEALRSVRGCQDVTLPYWDETSTDSQVTGFPGR